MSHLPTRSLVAALAVLSPQAPLEAHAAAASELDELVDAFAARTGARLVFTREEVPADAGFDVMPLLDAARRLDAARIALAEATKYPRGYLGAYNVTLSDSTVLSGSFEAIYCPQDVVCG